MNASHLHQRACLGPPALLGKEVECVIQLKGSTLPGHRRAQRRAGEIGSDTAHPGGSLSEDLWEVGRAPSLPTLSVFLVPVRPASRPSGRLRLSAPAARR